MSSFLFLQGVASPFFEALAAKLRNLGYPTYRINFCGGDLSLTQETAFSLFKGSLEELPGFYLNIFKQQKITDIFLFGDQRMIHQPAILIAQQQQISVHVFEEGYLRPFWVTLEKDGVNANSLLFHQIEALMAETSVLPKTTIKETHYSLRLRAYYDIKYRFFNLFYLWKFKNYQNHRPYNGFIEYFGWLKRFAFLSLYKKKADQLLKKLKQQKTAFFIFPLQLNSDAQIQVHSKFKDVKASIKEVITSFAQNADKNHFLVIKNHPLDTGIIHYRRYSQQIAHQYQIEHRVFFIDGGDFNAFIKEAKGMVLVNSTSGLQALKLNCPLCVLGKAIYDIKGLTFQYGLDLFWQEAETNKPQTSLVLKLEQILIQKTQINGDFFSNQGIDLTVKNTLNRLDIK